MRRAALWLLCISAGLWLAVGTLWVSEVSAQTSCESGFLALQRGDLSAAKAAFQAAPTDADCAADGVAIVESRERSAAAALTECNALLDKSKAPDADAELLLADAKERCQTATSVNPGLEDAQTALANVIAAQKALDEPGSTTDEIEEFSTSAWDATKRLLSVLGLWLAFIAVAMPLLALIQLSIGRFGRTRLIDIRTQLRHRWWFRIGIQAFLIAAIIGVLVGEGTFPDWAAWALTGGIALLFLAEVTAPGGAESRMARSVVGVAAITAYWVILQVAPEGSAVTVLLGLGALATLLAWVRAQTSAIKIGTFTDTSGKADPPTTFGPLVVAELSNLERPDRRSLDIVDAPLSTGVLDTESLNAMVGTESKLVGALYKLASALTRPSDYVVGGSLIEETAGGVSVTLNLKRGPRLVAATTLRARDFRLPAKGNASAGKDADASTAKDGGGDATAAKHPDLATAAACWILASFTRELASSDAAVKDALNGVLDWRSVAYEAVGSRRLRSGDLVGAAELYALAVDADDGNIAARFGLAQASGRRPEKESLQVIAFKASATAAAAILQHEPPPDIRLRCAYLYVAALANRNAIEQDDEARTNIRWAIGAEDAAEEAEADQVRAELVSVLNGTVQPRDASGRHLVEQVRSSLAPLQMEFDTPSRRKGEVESSEDKKKREERRRLAQKTIRGKYNLAAWHSARPLEEEESEETRLDAVLGLMLDVVALPELAAFALTDPYFKNVRSETAFKEIVGTAPEADVLPMSELASFILIGKERAKRLSSVKVRSFAELAEKSDIDLRKALGDMAPSADVIARWKDAAELAALPNLGVESLNLLTVAGVGSVAELATRDAVNLAALLDVAAGGLGRRNSPSVNTVRGWTSAARPQTNGANQDNTDGDGA